MAVTLNGASARHLLCSLLRFAWQRYTNIPQPATSLNEHSQVCLNSSDKAEPFNKS